MNVFNISSESTILFELFESVYCVIIYGYQLLLKGSVYVIVNH